MSTITIPRSGVTTEEVSEVLRRGLGPRYNVLPGKGMNWNPVGNPRADQPGKIVVGTGSTWLFRAQVTVSRDSGQTDLHVVAGGITLLVRLTNRLWIAEKVHRGSTDCAQPQLREHQARVPVVRHAFACRGLPGRTRGRRLRHGPARRLRCPHP